MKIIQTKKKKNQILSDSDSDSAQSEESGKDAELANSKKPAKNKPK